MGRMSDVTKGQLAPTAPDFRTVGELIERLRGLPPETPVKVLGADVGGYDVSEHSYGFVRIEDGCLLLDHLEREGYEKGWLYDFAPYMADRRRGSREPTG